MYSDATKLYSEKMFYFINSTYRNVERVLNPIEKITNLYKESTVSKNQIIDVISEDIKLQNKTSQSTIESVKRKISEINKMGFIKVSQYRCELSLDINLLNPMHINFDNKVDIDKEWHSNVFLYALCHEGRLEGITNLIVNINKKWSKIGHRKGITENEMAYLYLYTKTQGNQTIEELSNIIITLREEFKKQKEGKEKDFIKNQMNVKFTQIKVKNALDYIDTMIKSLKVTECFSVVRHGNSKYGQKLITINESFQEKIAFFLKYEKEELIELINKGTFCSELYKNFNVISAYKTTIEEINELIKENPQKWQLDMNLLIENKNFTWYDYEISNSLYLLQALKLHDEKYNSYTKKIATKTDGGIAYAGTTPGVADCYVVLEELILTVESAKLWQGFQQCNKEYIPIMSHLSDLMTIHNKNIGLCLMVVPEVSKEITLRCLENNFSNVLYDKKKILFPINTKNYMKLIQKVYDAQKYKRFIDYILLLNVKEYINNPNAFETILDNYLV